MKIIQFENLDCWKQARELVKMIYDITKKDKIYRDYRLRDQIVGARISVMNNIAEGFDSQSNNEFIRFLIISRRSAAEIRTCLYVALDQKYIDNEEFKTVSIQLEDTRKLIDGFLRYLRKYKKQMKRPYQP
jgi:four helix bundle protein